MQSTEHILCGVRLLGSFCYRVLHCEWFIEVRDEAVEIAFIINTFVAFITIQNQAVRMNSLFERSETAFFKRRFWLNGM